MCTAITVENLSKKYIIAHQLRERHPALRDAITNNAKRVFRRLRHPLGGFDTDDPQHEKFWALKDINFDIKKGDRIGVIGRNGAGKSTLLKILSRITEPSSGRIDISGRIASLLEVGTGFHPELTGRENIFLNGAVLGMKRVEIKRKFDEIVAFAQTEKFLDTPVKRYSSGMQVRLAFAIAAHLEPEILLIDEVLAVGDLGFQKKCLGKMNEVTRHGRTVFFVSHNIGMVRILCNKSILLTSGKITQYDDTQDVVETYLSVHKTEMGSNGEICWSKQTPGPGCDDIRLLSIRLLNNAGTAASVFTKDEIINIEIAYEVYRKLSGVRVHVTLTTEDGIVAFTSTNHGKGTEELMPGKFRSRATIPHDFLNVKTYYVKVYFDVPGIRALVPEDEYLFFKCDPGTPKGQFVSPSQAGVIAPELGWSNESIT